MKKPKILWVSDLVTPTGFSRVSHSILNYLHKKYEIVGLGVNYRGDPHSYQFPIYPASSGGHIFGEDRLATILENVDFDMVFILNDVWLVDLYLRTIKEKVKRKLPKIVVYFPVDSMNHDGNWYRNFDIVSKAVTYTEFGRSVVNHGHCAPKLELEVIPHGTDHSIFYRKFTNKRDAKISVFGDTKNPDSFIFLNANRNQPRKRLDISMKAFGIFSEGKKDVFLYMHCGVKDSHIDVARMAMQLKIDDKLILSNLNLGVQAVPDGVLNGIYNTCDVGLNSSLGEGWGLTSIEHAVTGAPQIVPDHSACAELFGDCGLLVPPVTDFTFDNSMTEGKLITPESMAEKMEIFYSDRSLLNTLSEKTLAKFTSPYYSWKTISSQWEKLFDECLTKDQRAVD